VETQCHPASEATGDPFERLGSDHAAIEQILRVIDALSARADRGQDVDRRDLAVAIDLLTEFCELGHHEKEEGILTPVLIAHGFDWYRGALAAVRREHRQEHYFMRVLGQLARQNAPWSSEDGRHFASVAREFTSFQRGHMRRERDDLFDLARRILPADTQRALVAAFDRFDREPEQVNARANLELMGRPLLDRYGIV
jgi:hemerythrin-like domain-containing protein